jgi:hypothetical protein
VVNATIYESYLNKDVNILFYFGDGDWTNTIIATFMNSIYEEKLFEPGMTIQGFVKFQKEHKIVSIKGDRDSREPTLIQMRKRMTHPAGNL